MMNFRLSKFSVFVAALLMTSGASAQGLDQAPSEAAPQLSAQISEPSSLRVDGESRRSRRGPRGEGRSGFGGSIGISQNMAMEARDGTSYDGRAGLDYGFYKSYSAGIGTSFRVPYGTDPLNHNGWGDISFKLNDRHLYNNSDAHINVSADLAYIMPVSTRSQRSSLQNAFHGGMRVRKGFDRFSVTYKTEVGRYFYEYLTADESGRRPNSPYAWDNGLTLGYRITDSVRASAGASIKTSIDYYDRTRNANSANVSCEWDATDSLSVTSGIRTSSGRGGGSSGESSGGGSGDSSGEEESGGSERSAPRSTNLFDSATTAFVFGGSYRF